MKQGNKEKEQIYFDIFIDFKSFIFNDLPCAIFNFQKIFYQTFCCSKKHPYLCAH